MEKDPLTRVLGFYKRFEEDIEGDKRKGKPTESRDHYDLFFFDEKSRYRHIQVVGGSGSGKSASIIAPMLRYDALTSKLATLTLNPKADLYLIKCMADLVMKRQKKEILANIPKEKRLPTAVVSFVRTQSLSYDPLLYGDADALTKKIIGSADMKVEFYKKFQETWIMSFFRVIKTERLLTGRIMLRHLHRFLTKPILMQDELRPLCEHEVNRHRLDILSATKVDSLAGVASHISQLVEDETLSHIFDNPGGHYLDLRDVLRKGGNIFVEVDNASKSSQGQALGRMIIMELQLFSGARQAGLEPDDIGVQAYLDEFASFAYSDFINLIDKSRSAKIGLLLAHQSYGNLKRDNLSKSFASEIVDNTFSKIFLAVKDETADWAGKMFGQVDKVKKTISTGQNVDTTSDGIRESTSISYSTQREDYLVRSDFNLPLGSGYAMIGDEKGVLRSGPCKVGYIDEKDLCSDAELLAFLENEKPNHGKRPRNGSLIDNDIDPGEPHHEIAAPTTMGDERELETGAFADPKFMDLEVLESINQKKKKEAESKKEEKPSSSPDKEKENISSSAPLADKENELPEPSRETKQGAPEKPANEKPIDDESVKHAVPEPEPEPIEAMEEPEPPEQEEPKHDPNQQDELYDEEW